MAKRIVIGTIAFVVFLILLSSWGRLDTVLNIARQVLPAPAPAAPAPVQAPPAVQDDLVDAGLVDGGTGLLRANEVVLVLDALGSTDDEADGYERESFGSRWSDTDGNGCDQRNDMLARDLTSVELRLDSTCVVVAGVLDDPFSGEEIQFQKADASAVHIDHLVALSWAWANGASEWSPEKRLAFANDPMNLTAVSADANRAKSDHGPADWRPDNPDYRCEYVTRFVRVLDSYELTVGERDRLASRRMLADCS